MLQILPNEDAKYILTIIVVISFRKKFLFFSNRAFVAVSFTLIFTWKRVIQIINN